MFHFLQPIWMLAAAGISIPIAIHLWNVKQGKILKVGSIAFLTQSSKRHSTSVKLTELLLLFVRCCLIILLAMLLARPQWQRTFQPHKEKGWLLMEKENISETYSRFRPLVDSLMQEGYEFHYFAPGFKKEKLPDALKAPVDTVMGNPLSYRLLVTQLDQLLPSELPVFLFTTNYLNRFTGSRPAVSLNLHWNTFTPADSVSTFIAKAYAISADSIRAVIGNSSPSATTFSYEDISTVKNENPGVALLYKDGRAFIAYNKNEPVTVDTGAINITVFTGKYFMDAKYIRAAVEAIRQFSRHIIHLQMPASVHAIPVKQDWLFWLSELPVPEKIKAANIFRYENGPEKNILSRINTTASINGDEEKISLFKMINASTTPHTSQPVWQDGFGDTVLSVEETSHTNTYCLFTHIDPAWNGLPWSSRFVQLIYTLLYPAEKKSNIDEHDKRTLPTAQLLPANGQENKMQVKQKFFTSDISSFFWLAVFILFCIERFIALRTGKELAHG